MRQPLTAMVSYQSDNSDAAELLHQELALRGLTVFHDRCSFPTGSRINQNMDDAVNCCDGFVAYLTPSSLYENSAAGTARPAIDSEFNPAMDRLVRSRATTGARRPVIIALTHGLGHPRTAAPERVRRATGKDISTLWTPVVLDQTTTGISQPEAASASQALIAGLLPPGTSNTDGPIELLVATRGEGQPPQFLTVDATALLGGRESRPGEPENWRRFLSGLRDLESVLAKWTPHRNLKIRAKTHLTAAIAIGRVFNQAAGWDPVIEGRHGATTPSDAETHPQLHAPLDKGATDADLSVEIDLLGVNIGNLAASVIAALPNVVPNRLNVWRDGKGDLTPSDVADMASVTAAHIRDATFDLHPPRLHLFCAAPVEFALLLGRRLTSLHCDLCLYERDGGRYVPSLVIQANVA